MNRPQSVLKAWASSARLLTSGVAVSTRSMVRLAAGLGQLDHITQTLGGVGDL